MFEKEFISLSETDIEKITKSLTFNDFLWRFWVAGIFEFNRLDSDSKNLCLLEFFNIRKDIDKTLNVVVSEIPFL